MYIVVIISSATVDVDVTIIFPPVAWDNNILKTIRDTTKKERKKKHI